MCHENDLSAHVFPLWRFKQKLLDAFLGRFASPDKKIRLISHLFAIFDTENASRSEKTNFHEKQSKVNFLILEPLCEKRENRFFFFFFSFSMIQRGLKAWIRTAALGFLTSESTEEAFDFAPVDLPTTEGFRNEKIFSDKN